MKSVEGKWNLNRVLPWLFLIAGTIAFLASLLLSVEVFNRLNNPGYIPVCSLSPILSCTSVADSWQSHVFGFPNYFIGIASYAALATIGTAMLAGARFKQWFWQAVQVGLTLAMIFVTWLQYESLYKIGSLCIFCMIVWAMTGPLFWYVTLFNLREGNIKTPTALEKPTAFAQRHHADLLLLWFLIIVGLVLKRFWFYWSSLF